MTPFPSRFGRIGWRLVSLVAVAAACATGAGADERLARAYGYQSGLSASAAVNLTQDRTGFLWISTTSGLFRFDGREFLKLLSSQGMLVDAMGAGDDVYYIDEERCLWRARGASCARVEGDDGKPLPAAALSAVSEDGSVWVLPKTGGRFIRKAPAGSWSSIEAPRGVAPGTAVLFPGRGGSVLVVGDDGVLRIEGDGTRRTVFSQKDVVRVEESPDGTLLLARWRSGRLEIGEVRGGTFRALFESQRRLVDFARRGDSVWIAFDSEVVAIRRGQRPESIGRADGLRGCNALFVDREGSLWLASYELGIVQYPEPDTVSREIPGFAPAVRSLVRTSRGVWAGGWFGSEYLDLSAGAPGVLRRGPATLNFPCSAGDDAIWTVARPDVLSLWGPEGERRAFRFPGLRLDYRCSAARDGGSWLPTNLGVLHVSHDARDVRLAMSDFPAAGTSPGVDWRVFESRSGEMFVAKEGTICRGRVDAGVPPPAIDWRCDTIDGATNIVGFADAPSGDVWIASFKTGIHRLSGGKWQRLPGSDLLASRALSALSAGADGTVWVSGTGVAVRVKERRDLPAGFEIVEELSAWQGLPTLSVSDIVEEPDGRLYIGSAGIISTPSSSRRIASDPPPVALVAATVDGRPNSPEEQLALPYRQNRVELHFAALSYRDPGRIRYRSRLRAGDDWSTPTTEPNLHLVGLAPGRYDVEVQATLDGERWTAPAAGIRLLVGRPLYLEPSFFTLVAVLVGAAVYGALRLRFEHVLRLERQRARIAMDLHDDLGSGLGSIGLLSDVLSRDALDADRRRRTGAQLAEIASGLSASLTDIVWALKPAAATLDSLAAHLLARGAALFSDGSPRFVNEIPRALPPVRLSVAVRRNVFLIGLEGLRNAVEHSGAAEVRLSLRPEGRRWRLTIADDGRGLPAPPAAAPPGGKGRGLGLLSMRARADEIRASIEWTPTPGGGTTLSVVFLPHAGARAGDDRSR